MEEKLNGLLTMMSKNGAQHATPLPSEPVDPISHVTDSPQMFSPTSPAPRSRPPTTKTFYQFGIAAFPTLTSPPDIVFDGFYDIITRGIISCAQAEESIRYFQSTAGNFPFVIIPSHTTLDYLRRERPFFLLSVLAMAAQSNLKLQGLLEQELRESMGKRIVMNGEKSMDLLQGLLNYLAW